jgi:fumarylacetoacetate (FAA) hydrolase family protein
MSPRGKGSVTEEHKAAMAQGRTEGRAISVYLEALEQHRPKRGRKRTPESIDKQLADIETKLATANAITRLSLVQQKLDLQKEKESMGAPVDLSAVEAAFVTAAKGYSERKGISYAAWREIGVPADVLKKAGITR